MISNCYIHIPFCSKICSYCDFCKIYYNKELVDKYLIALEKEIDLLYKNEVLESIYIGGGTPSCLTIDQLDKLFNILAKLKKSKNIEYTIEGNIESTTQEKLKLYKKYGINRLSIGIETTIKKQLSFLNRELSKENTKTIINMARKLGFNNINLDLMYALPNETIVDLDKDLNFLLSLNVEHISTYSLIIEEHTMLYNKDIKNISEDTDYKMYNYICKKLKDNNYIHYEISNFSKKGYYSKHNTCYWDNKNYYGFGLGAASYIKNKRINNTRSITQYINGNYIKEEETINIEDKIEYEIILNLRKREGINLISFNRKFHKSLKEIYNYNYLLEQGFITEKNNHLFITEDKWYISNEIITKILENKNE